MSATASPNSLLAWASFSQVARSDSESKASSNVVALLGKGLVENPCDSSKHLDGDAFVLARRSPKDNTIFLPRVPQTPFSRLGFSFHRRSFTPLPPFPAALACRDT